MKSVLINLYTFTLIVLTAYLLNSCATCPGAKNLAYPQFYKAQDLMQYNLNEECMLSKTNTAEKRISEWVGTINSTDDIIFSFRDDKLSYFHLIHHGSSEDMYQLFGRYITFFKLYARDYKYSSGFNFKCNYLIWSVECNLNSGNLSLVCTRKG